MREKLRRYGKQVMVFICTLVIFAGSVFSFSFKSNAASKEYYVNYSQPTADDKCGYFNVDSTNGGGTLYTYFWNLTGTYSNSNMTPTCEMYVRIQGNKVIFHPYVYGGSGTTYLTLGYFDSNGGVTFVYYGGIGLNDYERVEQFIGINGISFGGNCSFGTSGYSGSTPLIHWNDSVDAQNLNTKLNSILSSLSNIDGDTSVIINKLQDIYNQNVSINSKLSAMNTLLNEIKSEQEQTNTWLEKIWNSIQEFLGKEPAEDAAPPVDEDNMLGSMEETEEALFPDTSEAEQSLNVQLNSGFSVLTWLVESFAKMDAGVFSMFLTMLTFGVMALLLGR